MNEQGFKGCCRRFQSSTAENWKKGRAKRSTSIQGGKINETAGTEITNCAANVKKCLQVYWSFAYESFEEEQKAVRLSASE